jgi:hypothetical protein
MRYIPSDRHGSLLLSALRETSHNHSVPDEVAQTVQANTSAYLEARGGRQEKELTAVDVQIASYFLKWGKALEAEDEQAAREYEAKIDELAKQHQFPYKETKQLFYEYHTKSSYEAALKNYRAWDGKNPEFGVIKATIPGEGKVGLFGDWGTGTQDAVLLFKQMMRHQPDVLLHLGDIYEAGTPYECQEYFLKPMEKVCKDNGWTLPPIFTIPGNHEYFTAAQGYFELLAVLNHEHGEQWLQEASFFCLRSDDGKWQFLGADSEIQGIRETSQPGLEPSELAWHQDKLKSFSGRSVLMTHHQFVTGDDVLNEAAKGTDYQYFNSNLVDGFKASVDGGEETYFDKIDLWAWGHDHWFLPYIDNLPIPAPGTQDLKLKRGQLLGGSARETTQKTRKVQFLSAVQQIDGEYILPAITNDNLYNHTYGIIDLGAATVSYYQVPAWLWDNTTPNKTSPTEPIHVAKL